MHAARSSDSGRSTLLTPVRRVAATRVIAMSDAEAAAATPVLAAPSTPRSSLEDLSEYTDADESVSSAPTEFLAEFLSALMQRDYETALKYCKLILQYEPNNTTAKDFYPLILEKIHLMKTQQDASLDSTGSSSSSSNSADRIDDNGNACPSTGASDGIRSTTSSSSSGDSDSEGTTASYSSLEDDEADGNGNVSRGTASHLLPLTGTPTPQTVSSDSESPTEPVSQRLAQLRAQVVPRGRP